MRATAADRISTSAEQLFSARSGRPERWAALIFGALSALAGFVAAFVSQGGSLDPKAMIDLAGTDPLAELVRAGDPHFPLVTPAQHYDGVYYYAIARDPFALGQAHSLIDQAAYRYGHPLHGWLAFGLSAGHPDAIPAALFALSLIGLGAAGWLASRLAHDLGGRPWLGLLVATSPGLLYSATVSTTEAVGAALVLGALLFWHRRRIGLASALLMLACLDKEQYVALPVGLAAFEIIGCFRERSWTAGARRRLAALALAPVPLAVWYLYVVSRLHQWPADYQDGNLGWPIHGWLMTFNDAHTLTLGDFNESEIGSVTAPTLVALAALLVTAAARGAWLHSNVLHLPLVILVIITSCQGWRTLLYPHELVRTPSVAALLALLVLLTPERRTPVQRDKQSKDKLDAHFADDQANGGIVGSQLVHRRLFDRPDTIEKKNLHGTTLTRSYTRMPEQIPSSANE